MTNSLTPHSSKCEVMLFHRGSFTGPLPLITIGNDNVAWVCHTRLLGITINRKLTWANHLKALRLLQTFAGVLQKKIRTHAVLKETPTNYISIERLWNVEFDKIIFFFADCFPMAAEAVNVKTTDWNSGELIGYQMQSLMQNNCAVLITKHQSLKACQHFLLLVLVIFL